MSQPAYNVRFYARYGLLVRGLRPPSEYPENTLKPSGRQPVGTLKPPREYPENTQRIPSGYPEAPTTCCFPVSGLLIPFLAQVLHEFGRTVCLNAICPGVNG